MQIFSLEKYLWNMGEQITMVRVGTVVIQTRNGTAMAVEQMDIFNTPTGVSKAVSQSVGNVRLLHRSRAQVS